MSVASLSGQQLKIKGHGLITGEPCSVEIKQGEPGQGLVFVVNGTRIAATPEAIVHTENGITLADERRQQTLSIVEHALGAVSLLGLDDLTFTVIGAPELPILDGSAYEWATLLHPLKAAQQPGKTGPFYSLKLAFCYKAPEGSAQVMVLPSDRLKITYSLNFPHPLTQEQFITWDSATDSPDLLLKARTFGLSRHLPALQSKGLARGVRLENTLGLNDDGTTTTPLRFESEPLYHKALDLVGDLMLCGLPARQCQLHFVAQYAGHGLHVAFAQALKPLLYPTQ